MKLYYKNDLKLKKTQNDEKMYSKLTIFGACAPYPYIELHCLSRKERKMRCHQNPGPGDEKDDKLKLWRQLCLNLLTFVCKKT